MSVDAVVLVGHGGVPTDFPRKDLARLKALESRRRAEGGAMTDEERELDAAIRSWPRTAETDPYKAGFERLAASLAAELGETRLYLAYNEFCAPALEQAVARAIADGARAVTVVPSMLTPGGVHAEIEIPEVIAALREVHAGVEIAYAWPFALEHVARFFADHVRRGHGSAM
jgi:sirohydrochlorin cobaltochelatase